MGRHHSGSYQQLAKRGARLALPFALHVPARDNDSFRFLTFFEIRARRFFISDVKSFVSRVRASEIFGSAASFFHAASRRAFRCGFALC